MDILSNPQLCNYSVQHYVDRSIGKSGEIQQKQFGDRFFHSTGDHRKSHKLHAREALWEQDPVQPKIEPVRGNLLRDTSEQAQCSRIDIRIQGAPEQSPDNENEGNISLNDMMAELFPKNDDQ